ncbi:MAG: 4'-phosphopantetheinyl transferase superfamily protein [Ferruginibacter sp.]
MTGNDIVDITTADTESNWKRPGFLEKIFTQKEQQYIHEAAAPTQMVWRLWTMKESAYKIYTRRFGGRFFAPQKLSCNGLSQSAGLVTINNISYQCNTIKTNNYIYSVARQMGTLHVDFINSWFYLPPGCLYTAQLFISKKIIDSYHAVSGGVKKNTALLKDKNGVPFLYCGSNLQIPVSITHHGNYAAFTIN